MLDIFVLYSFPLLNCFPLYEFTMCQFVHSPIGRHWIASSFDFQEQQHYEHLHTSLCVYIVFIFLGRCSWDGFPGLYVSVCLTFSKSTYIPKCALPFYILSAMCAGSHFFTSSTLLDDVILNFNHFYMYGVSL